MILCSSVPARSFVCLTNIPTPYRLFQFRLMHRELADRGWKFEVWFMAASEPRREWKFTETRVDFPFRLLRGLRPRVASDPLYLNFEIPHLLRETRPDVLLVAGAWTHPSVWMASMSSVPKKTIFWSESHLNSIRQMGAVAQWGRRLVLSRFREFAVPGCLAKRYVEHYSKPDRIYLLPNIVDPSVFRGTTRNDRCAMQSSDGERRRVLLISARLAPEKGLIEFLSGLAPLKADDKRGLVVRIAGSGPQLKELQGWIRAHDLEVHLLGHQTEAEMVKLYAEADGFCLPSILDPNPLSVIEGLWAGLPLLLSSRVGNHVECLQEDDNGFLFNPGDPKSVAHAVSRWLELSPPELARFGNRSLDIAQSQFEPESVIRSFLHQVIEDPWHKVEHIAEPVEMIAP